MALFNQDGNTIPMKPGPDPKSAKQKIEISQANIKRVQDRISERLKAWDEMSFEEKRDYLSFDIQFPYMIVEMLEHKEQTESGIYIPEKSMKNLKGTKTKVGKVNLLYLKRSLFRSIRCVSFLKNQLHPIMVKEIIS